MLKKKIALIILGTVAICGMIGFGWNALALKEDSHDHEDDTGGCPADDPLLLITEMSAGNQRDGAAHADSKHADPEE